MNGFPPDLKGCLERLHRERVERLRRRYEEALRALAESGLVEKHRAEVLVFGSFVRGELAEHSDLDVAVARAEDPYVFIAEMLGVFERVLGGEGRVEICYFPHTPDFIKEEILREGKRLEEVVSVERKA